MHVPEVVGSETCGCGTIYSADLVVLLLPESTLWLAVICPHKSQNSTTDLH